MNSYRAKTFLLSSILSISTYAEPCDPTKLWLEGEWQLNSDPALIETAIHQATEDMNFMIRGIARKRLKTTNKPHDQLTFSQTSSHWQLAFGKNTPIPFNKTGEAEDWQKPDGEMIQVKPEISIIKEDSGSFVKDKNRQVIFIAEDGIKRFLFRCLSDEMLAVDVSLSSSKLNAPLEYTLEYKSHNSFE